MLLKSRAIAFAGMATALAVIIVTLAGYIDVSTLFLLALSSFMGGIVTRYYGVKYGVGFLMASSMLSFILAPQKMYVLTYTCMVIYVIVAECMERRRNDDSVEYNVIVSWIIKALVYNASVAVVIVINYYFFGFDMYEGSRLFKLLSSNLTFGIILLVLCLEFMMVVFDKVYIFFMNKFGWLIRENVQ